MTKYARTLLYALAVGCALALAFVASAAPTGTTCSNAGCFVDATGDIRTNAGAATDSFDVEVCVTTVTRNRTLATTEYLTGAKSLYVENRSSATCYLTFDAVNLTTTGGGATGYKFAAGTERSFDVDGSIFGPLIGVNCTATTTTPACLFFGWLK
jgi:hypothetical protein